MSLGLAERVEVVKGPASVLYGTGALGGAVNVLLAPGQVRAPVSAFEVDGGLRQRQQAGCAAPG
jgi:outer membrane receptor protein involved in Fe transport